MALRLICLHGHHLELTSEAPPTRVVCPVCGCVNELLRDFEVRESGSREVTQILPSGADSQASISKSSPETPTQYYDDTVQDETARHPDAAISPTLPSDANLVVAQGRGVTNDDASMQTGDFGYPEESPSRDAIAIGHEPAELERDFTPPELEDYEVLGELGRGGMGVVYHAWEKQHGRHVAVKTLQRMSPVELQHFKKEFRTLADVAHPNLASLYSLLSDGKTWCFTMELLDGVDCLSYVWSGFRSSDRFATQSDLPEQRLSVTQLQRLKQVLKQLALGLHGLHSAGLLHRDLKPSNVMVLAEGSLKLVDFGLSAEIRQNSRTRQPRRIQGTPEYMAPEQAACTSIGRASDWYAVGVMLYEVLTGRLPIQGTPIQILVGKQTRLPPEPRAIEPSTPEDLNDLCMRMLRHDPSERPVAADVLRCLGEHELAATLRDTQVGQEHSFEIVGRERHLAVLCGHYEEVAAGGTLSVFVHGRSGMGKTVLIRRFLDELSSGRKVIILEGRCYEQESVPFKSLDSLIDSLAAYLDTLPDRVAANIQPRDPLPLIRLFPVLGQVLRATEDAASIETADQQELRQRALDGLRETLRALSKFEPLVLYIDDLQWGDEDSAGMLADLGRPPDAPRMLLLGTYRSEETATSSSLQALRSAYARGQNRPRHEELAVESLSHEEARELALRLLCGAGEDALRHADRIACESGGGPFFVWELAQHVQDEPLESASSLELDEVIWRRVCRLPDDARRLLELFAVAGRPMPAPQAYEAIERVSQGPGLLAQLRANNFVRILESHDEVVVETYHDRIRESVVHHLPRQTVREKNLMLALAVERSSGISVAALQEHLRQTAGYEEVGQPCELTKPQWQRVFDLSSFFSAAGKIERAFPYALVAAEKAWRMNALDVAEQQYRIAAEGCGTEDAIKFRVAEGLGEVLLTRGRYEEAATQLQTARQLAQGSVPLARLDGKLGFVAFKTGDMGTSQEHFERALSELGNAPPRSLAAQAAALLKETLVQALHSTFPAQFVGRRSANSERCRMDMLRASLYDGLGYPYWFRKGPLQTLWTHLRHMNLAERYPPSPELGRAYAMHGVIATAIPMARRGAAYADRAYRIHCDQGDLQGQGKARSFQTFSLLALGRFRKGVECGSKAVRLLEQAGDVWEANMARIIVSQPMYYLGDLQGCHRTAKRAYEIGKETGDYSAMAIALYFWVPSAPFALPEGALQAERERPREDPLSTSAAIQGRGLELLLREDRPREALDVLQESLDVARARGLRNPAIFCGVTWKATAARIAAERESGGSARETALAQAKKAVRAALQITKSYRTCRPRALRELALIHVMEGRPHRARRFFGESLRVAERQEAAYERALTLLARGQAGLTFGWPDAEQEVALGRAQVEAMDRFDI